MERSLTELLSNALPTYGVVLEAKAIARLVSYLEKLVVWNRRIRLVGSADPESLVRRHVGESLFITTVVKIERQSIVDVGSGAGFPGMALQLAFPELKTTLVESNAKKAAFLKELVRDHGLGRVMTGRIEDLETDPVDLITVRAMEKLVSGPHWARGRLRSGGRLAAWVSLETAQLWAKVETDWQWSRPVLIPGSSSRAIVFGTPK